MSLTKKLIVGSGSLVWLFAGGGIAAAAPDVSALTTTTCTYPQAMAALNLQSPKPAATTDSAQGAPKGAPSFISAADRRSPPL